METGRIRTQIIVSTAKYLLMAIEMHVREKPVFYTNEFTIPSHFL